jgi:predicted alpha/beta-hydrolase family hydrolase
VTSSKSPSELNVSLEAGATTALVYPAAGPATLAPARANRAPGSPIGGALILGHGAGAGQRSRFMVDTAQALSGLGLDTVTFDFPYIHQKRRIPDRAPVLEACYRSVIEAVRRELAARHLFIGGKSMGGRISTQVAAADNQLPISGLVLLGYPLHPPGRVEQRRDKHLPAIQHPMLFVQGSRDAFGTPAELEPVLAALPRTATLHVVPGGDHSFKVGRAAAATQTAVMEGIYRTIASWMTSVMST